MLELKKVTLQNKAKEILLADVTQSFSAQQPNFILGASGVGKTTLLQAILGDVPICQGQILLNGCSLHPKTMKELLAQRRTIGMIFQDFRLIESWTAFQNIAYVLKIKGCAAADIAPKVEQISAELGIANQLHHLCEELSGGEKQRVAIARALIKEPKLLLADEPTGNLDPKNGQQVMELLSQSATEKGITTLIVTHDYQALPQEKKTLFRLTNQKMTEYVGGFDE